MDDSDCESVVANSEESDRTPSPSILGGLELLDRRTVITDVSNASCDDKENLVTSKQKAPASGIPADNEQRWKDFSTSGTANETERSYSPADPYPAFKKVENYHHSPVFTPPRKFFRPASSLSGDQNVNVTSQGLSSMQLPLGTGKAGVMDGCSQVLFSGSKENSMSQPLSLLHREAKSVQEDQNRGLDNFPRDSSCSTSDMIYQSTNCEENLCELAIPFGNGEKPDTPMVTQATHQTLAPRDMSQPNMMDSKLKEGLHSDELPSRSISSQTLSFDNSQVEKDSKVALPKSKVSLQSSEKQEMSTSHSTDTSTPASIQVGNLWNSSEQDDSKPLESLEEKYVMFTNVVEEGRRPLEALKQDLKKLQQGLKDEAQKIQDQRVLIMSHNPEMMSENQQQQQRQELFNLSRKQRHLIYIVNIHKRVSNNLTDKEVHPLQSGVTGDQWENLASDKTNAKEVSQLPSQEKAPDTHGHDPTVVKRKAVENRSVPISVTDGTTQNEVSQDVDSPSSSQMSQCAAIQMQMPQLAMRDLIEYGLLEPTKGCMSFVYEGKKVSADLRLDGSILSDGVLYKTEKEWFLSISGLPAPSIRKPRLWSLIKYDDKPLKALADQCQLLSIAKKIEAPKPDMTKMTSILSQDVKANCPRSLKPTTKLSSIAKEKLQSKDHFDPSMIKSLVLINNNELFSEDDLLTNGFWENEAAGSLIPSHWLKEINSWEE